MALLNVGDKAPDFTLPNQDNKLIKLSDFAGRYVVIYFYPKALTPGCTAQACDLRDSLQILQDYNATVLGISADKPVLLKRFQEEEHLNFNLLSDVEHKVIDAYGAWQEKSMYGKTYMGIQRMSYILAPNLTVMQVLPKVSPKTHLVEVMQAISLK